MNVAHHVGTHDLFPDGRLAERFSAEKLSGISSMMLTIRDLSMAMMDATLLNISETGLGVVMQQELAVGQMVAVSSVRDDVMPTKAVVMWCSKENKDCRVGLKFINAS